VEQNIDNRHKEILWDLLANPAENGQLYKHNLEQLVQDNPQSGLLQVMYVRSLKTPDIRKASAYFSPKVLHKLMHDPDGLLPVSRDRINKTLNGSQPAEPENYFNIGNITEAEAEAAEVINDAQAESPVAQEHAQSAGNFKPTGELLPAHEEPQLPEEHQEEKTFETPVQEFVTAVPEPVARYTPVETQPTTAAGNDDDDDEFANPWDFSKLTGPEEIAVSAQEEVVDSNAAKAQAAPAPEEEKQPEPATEIEADPIEEIAPAPLIDLQPATATGTTTGEPTIETYDHSLSTLEGFAVNRPTEDTKTEPEEVSSFDSYRPENVFHKQDHIEDEVYDEIVSIDEIGVESIGNKFAEDSTTEDPIPEPQEADEEATAAQQDIIADETERLIYGNIAATDYLSFDKKLDELRAGIVNTPAATEQPAPVAEAPAPQAVADAQPPAEAQLPVTTPEPQTQLAEIAKEPVVSKYNDDTMPYSFMWWLDKTRKEHASVNQPYAAAEQAKPAEADAAKKGHSDELQQQYFANIFSLTSVSSIGDLEPPQIAFDPGKKEDVIIERFIHTDPQIKPLAADKLDTENKARKSSEDQDVMVTETLARIYGDQMLYHKAIATYKKLMLKIPEKKLYFAAQIEQLEKKIN
jgi:hypothetical protein